MKRITLIASLMLTLSFSNAQKLTGSYYLKDVIPFYDLNVVLNNDLYSIDLMYNSGPDDLPVRANISCGSYMTTNNKIILYDIYRDDCFILTMIDSNNLQVNKMYFVKAGSILNGYPKYIKYLYPEDSLMIESFKSIPDYPNIILPPPDSPIKTKNGYYNATEWETQLRLYKDHSFKLLFGLTNNPITIFEGQWWDKGDTIVLYDHAYKCNYFLRHTKKPNELYPINVPTLYGHELLKYMGTRNEIEGNLFQKAIGHMERWFTQLWKYLFGN